MPEPLKANNLNDLVDIVDFLDNTETCAKLNFLALRYAIGLPPWIDGILGLSPNFEPEFDDGHILAKLRDQGAIDEAIVSFSIGN